VAEHGGETVEDGELMQDLDGSPDIHRESSFKIALSLTRAKGDGRWTVRIVRTGIG